MSKKNNCKNVGCCETFSRPMQVARQRAKCQHPEPVVRKKYNLIDGKYSCAKCSKKFVHQASATRHGNIDCAKGKKGHKCTICSKVFPFKSQLANHKKVQAKLTSQKCQKCQRYFRRKDLFLKHKELCFANPSEVNDSFVPTFIPITNRIDIKLYESQETTESPLD